MPSDVTGRLISYQGIRVSGNTNVRTYQEIDPIRLLGPPLISVTLSATVWHFFLATPCGGGSFFQGGRTLISVTSFATARPIFTIPHRPSVRQSFTNPSSLQKNRFSFSPTARCFFNFFGCAFPNSVTFSATVWWDEP